MRKRRRLKEELKQHQKKKKRKEMDEGQEDTITGLAFTGDKSYYSTTRDNTRFYCYVSNKNVYDKLHTTQTTMNRFVETQC
jgi:hypothetical protein